MSLKGLFRDIQDFRGGIGSISRKGFDALNRSRSHVAAEELVELKHRKVTREEEGEEEHQNQVQRPADKEEEEDNESSIWEDLPSDLVRDIIKRVDASNSSWPSRGTVVACAGVCNAWREIVQETVGSLEDTGKFTLLSSVKQPGPKDNIVQCFIKRDRATASYQVFLGLTPTLVENGKFLMGAKRIRRATNTEYVISVDPEDMSRSSYSCIGKLRSNFLGTKFSVYDTQPLQSGVAVTNARPRQASQRVSAGGYNVANIAYELNVLGSRGPRRMQCTLHTVPAPATGTTEDVRLSAKPSGSASGAGETRSSSYMSGEPLVLKNKSPRWHNQLQCWCLNFRGRVTVASVKNFQLVAAVDQPAPGAQPEAAPAPAPDGQAQDGGAAPAPEGQGQGGEGDGAAPGAPAPADQDKVLLQFGKIGKDMFTMDYRYPLSAFQAFAICLSSFDTKLACE